MKNLLFFMAAIMLATQQGFTQSQEVPLGVKLTPAFQVPPIALQNFATNFQGQKAEWKPYGAHYAAMYTHKDQQNRHVLLYDRNGQILWHDARLSRKEYPRQIGQFFAGNYPDEPFEVWSRSDSTGLKEYYAIHADTVWFNREGRYAWNRANKGHTLNESDLELLAHTASAQIMDVTLAQLALVNAGSAELKNAAGIRAGNNATMHRELQQLAMRKHLSLPTELSHPQQNALNKLKQLQGRDFDRAYARFVLKEDKRHSARLSRGLKYAGDSDVSEWLRMAMPLTEQNTAAIRNACYSR